VATDRRLRDRERGRGAPEVQALRHGDERAQVPELEIHSETESQMSVRVLEIARHDA
jgi:hypothetical protein